jgi:hypothetical protein
LRGRRLIFDQQDTHDNRADRSLEQYEWGALSLQAAGGLEVRLGRRLYAAGEYKLTRTVQEVSVVGGAARTGLTTHHVTVGLVAHLGDRR